MTLWAATTKDGFRDFRLYNCRSGPSQNCTHYEGQPTGQPGFPSAHAVPYLAKALEASSDGVYVGSVPAPAKGQHISFFLEARWAEAQGAYRFTTQASIARFDEICKVLCSKLLK